MCGRCGAAEARPGALPADSTVPAEWFCALTWPVKPLATQPDPSPDGRWLVVGEARVGDQMARLLGAPVSIRAAGDDDLAEAVAAATHVLYAPDGSDSDELGYDLFETGRVIAAAAAGSPTPPAVYLLTRNAQPVDEGTAPIPRRPSSGDSAALWPSNTPRSGAA